jgi:uncharacterized DUF497 family protein
VQVHEVIWLDTVVEKLWRKHHVSVDEVEQVLSRRPRVRKVARGDIAGEDVYAAMGRTTGGRHLMVFYVLKAGAQALVISARQMSTKERRQYAKK